MNREYPKGQMVEVPAGTGSSHQRYLELLAAQMDTGEIDLTWGDRSLAALELCEAAYLSSRVDRAVRLPLSTFAATEEIEWDVGRTYAGSGGGRDGRRLAEVAR
jgi:hypothetical protein